MMRSYHLHRGWGAASKLGDEISTTRDSEGFASTLVMKSVQ